jgi:hypothetical protein
MQTNPHARKPLLGPAHLLIGGMRSRPEGPLKAENRGTRTSSSPLVARLVHPWADRAAHMGHTLAHGKQIKQRNDYDTYSASTKK